MNTVRSLTFLWTPWSVTCSFVVIVVASTLSWIAWRRSGYARFQGWLELLRVFLVGTAVLLLNQPEWIEEYRSAEKPALVVLNDASESMSTRDVVPESGKEPLSRREAVAHWTQPESWNVLHKDWNVVFRPFSLPQPGRGTDLHQALHEVAQDEANLRAVVLISDGDWNEGEPPVLAGTKLRLRNIPVYAVTAGSESRLPDLELSGVEVPTFGVAGKAVHIPFVVESSLPRRHSTTVVLRASDGQEIRKEVQIRAMGRTSDVLVWKPASVGSFTLDLQVPKHPDELLSDNNQVSVPISIREEKLRVLLVESYPRWEYRYLRNALSRDPGIELSCLLFHPDLSKVGGGSKDYIQRFPDELDELTKYDVVFLGDVGVENGQLTLEQCRLLKGLVEHQASGLVFMPGWQGRQSSLVDSPLGDLVPVVMDTTQPSGWGSRTAAQFQLTETGRRSLLTKLADNIEDNDEVWEGLPGFQWYASVVRAKAGTEVLATHKDVSNEHGRLPLLVTRTFGAGKLLFMGTDGAWRWRKGVEDKYHYRFWGQVVRWMAYQRNMAKGESMRLYYSPDQPQMHQTITLHANVVSPSGEPLQSGDVTARIVAPSGKAAVVRLQADGSEWGMFTGLHTAAEPGKHELTLTCPQATGKLTTTLFVQGVAIERVGRPARPEVLAELSRLTRGQFVERANLSDVLHDLARLPEPPPKIRRLQLWSNPVVAGALIGLLAIFWIGRKANGLI